MKLIPLNTIRKSKHPDAPKFVMVDDEDYDFLMQWVWYAKKSRNTWYACRTKEDIRMHRVLLGVTDPNVLVDHRDHNGVNNQRNNIRKATRAQNGQNKTVMKGKASNFLGVYLTRCYKKYTVKSGEEKLWEKIKWIAQIKTSEGIKQLGYFPNTPEGEIAAAKAYDEAAKKYFGEFANLNFKEQ